MCIETLQINMSELIEIHHNHILHCKVYQQNFEKHNNQSCTFCIVKYTSKIMPKGTIQVAGPKT